MRPPLRVVVLGNSVGYFVMDRVSPTDGSYGERLEQQLHEEGQPVLLFNESRWLARVDEIFRDAEALVVRHSPDVVIVNVGFVECQPLVVPLPVLRWTMSWRPRLDPLTLLLRRTLRPAIKRVHFEWGPRWIRAGGPVPSRLGVPRFERELTRLVALLRQRFQCLVLLLDVNPGNEAVAATLPDIEDRTARYSRAIERVARSFDDSDVRHVPVRAVVTADPRAADTLVPDGIHYSAAGHQRVAELLHTEIRAWICRITDRGGSPPSTAEAPAAGGHPM